MTAFGQKQSSDVGTEICACTLTLAPATNFITPDEHPHEPLDPGAVRKSDIGSRRHLAVPGALVFR